MPHSPILICSLLLYVTCNLGGEGSSGGTNDEAADLSTILSAFAALDASPQGQGQGASTSSDNNASKISDRLKEIAENAKNKGVVCKRSEEERRGVEKAYWFIFKIGTRGYGRRGLGKDVTRF